MINAWEQEDDEIYDYVKETSGIDPEYVQTYIEIGHDAGMNYIFTLEMSEQTSEIIEEYRRKAIDYFYDQKEEHIINGTMTIRNYDQSSQFYQYDLEEFPDLETLKKLAQDPAVKIFIATFDREYRMKSDGTLMISELYNQ